MNAIPSLASVTLLPLAVPLFTFFPCCCGVVIVAPLLAFWVWMLVDAIKHESPVDNEKLIWVLIIVLTGWIGALIYFFMRKDKNRTPRPPGA